MVACTSGLACTTAVGPGLHLAVGAWPAPSCGSCLDALHASAQIPPPPPQPLTPTCSSVPARHTDSPLLPCICSISTVYKALCIATRQAVIIKSYEKAKMKQKNFLRMEREIKLMNMLGEAQAAWQQLMAAKMCRPGLPGSAALQAAGVQAQPSDVGCGSLTLTCETRSPGCPSAYASCKSIIATAPGAILSALEPSLRCDHASSVLLLLNPVLSSGCRAQRLLGASKSAKAAARFCGSPMQAADCHISPSAKHVQPVLPAGGDGLVQLYSVFEEDTHKHLIMEFCKGGDLFKLLLLRGGTLEEHWVCMEVGCPRHAASCAPRGPTTAAQHTGEHTVLGSAWSAAFRTTQPPIACPGLLCAAWKDAGMQPPACSILGNLTGRLHKQLRLQSIA